MVTVMKRLSGLLRALLAGFMISVGCTVFLASGNKYAGALLFSVGLMTVVFFGLHLYTGRICYVADNGAEYLLDTVLSVVGNFAGCALAGLMKSPVGSVAELCAGKLAKTLPEVLADAFLCGVLIYISVDIYKKRNSFIGILVCIPAFILAGFEHSVADMFYFINARSLTTEALGFLVTVILGNAAGGLFIPLVMRAVRALEAKTEKVKF